MSKFTDQAIRNTHPSVVTIVFDDPIKAFDASEKPVAIDMAAAEAEIAALEAAEATKPPPAIETTKLRFALELRRRGLWPSVKATIDANEEAKLYWELTHLVTSDSAIVLSMGAALGLDGAAIRSLILGANALDV
jgi:hypothetical protein